ncbi:MAG TPA: transferase [Arthrobacter sp.]|nr:transferase [Arthrobacter sp.]
MSRQFESVEDDAGGVVRYRRHANGGGFVGRGAVVPESARLGSMTYVEPEARIGAGARIGRGSWIDRRAQVGERTVIGDGVRVGHGAVIGNRVHIGSHSRIGAGAVIGHGASLAADSTVPDGVRVAAQPRRSGMVPDRSRQRTRKPQQKVAA